MGADTNEVRIRGHWSVGTDYDGEGEFQPDRDQLDPHELDPDIYPAVLILNPAVAAPEPEGDEREVWIDAGGNLHVASGGEVEGFSLDGFPDYAIDALRARLRSEPAPVEERGQWVHCSPALLSAGVSCADTPRRPCECYRDGSHDHFIAHDRSRSPEPSDPIALAEQVCAEGWVGDSETPLDGYGMECIREFARILAGSTGDEPVGGSDG